MYLDGPLDIPSLAKQLTDSDVGLDRLRVDLKRANKGFDGLVRLLVQQVVEANKILLVDGTAVRLQHKTDLDCLTAPQKPAYRQSQHKQPKEHQFLHDYQPLTAWVRSLSISLR